MIKLSSAAQQHLQEKLAQSPEGTLGIRIGLRDAGCSGFAYTIDFTKDADPDDQIFAFDTVKIIIAEKFIPALRGMEIDYEVQGANQLLKYNNPNVINACGCGESVQFKDAE